MKSCSQEKQSIYEKEKMSASISPLIESIIYYQNAFAINEGIFVRIVAIAVSIKILYLILFCRRKAGFQISSFGY